MREIRRCAAPKSGGLQAAGEGHSGLGVACNYGGPLYGILTVESQRVMAFQSMPLARISHHTADRLAKKAMKSIW